MLLLVCRTPLTGLSQGEGELAMLQTVSFDEFNSAYQECKSEGKGIVLDIRTPQEYDKGHSSAAENIDYYAADFKQQLNKMDREETYFIYCNSGSRSEKSLKLFEQLGFKKVYNLKGGWIWNRHGVLSLE